MRRARRPISPGCAPRSGSRGAPRRPAKFRSAPWSGAATRSSARRTTREFLAIRRALAALDTDRLSDYTLYVTLEPCAQCAGAIVLAKVGRVVYGAVDEKAGMAGSVGDLLRHPHLNHRPEVLGGVLAAECGALLAEFFRARRDRAPA